MTDYWRGACAGLWTGLALGILYMVFGLAAVSILALLGLAGMAARDLWRLGWRDRLREARESAATSWRARRASRRWR